MAWWKQFLIAAAAFFAGMVFMGLWFDRNFGELGVDTPYSRAAMEIGVAIALLAIAFLIANWSKSKRALEP